jgi:hypothetical protein
VQVAREDGGFVAARRGTDLEEDVVLVERIRRNQQLLQRRSSRQPRLKHRILIWSACAGVGVRSDCPPRARVRIQGAQAAQSVDARKFHDGSGIDRSARNLRVGEQLSVSACRSRPLSRRPIDPSAGRPSGNGRPHPAAGVARSAASRAPRSACKGGW